MAAASSLPSVPRLRGAIVSLCLGLAVACSVVMDDNKDQCESDADCAPFGDARCDRNRRVCVASETDGCRGSAVPPGPPAMAGAGDTFTFGLAINSMQWGESDVPPTSSSIGYDLDGLCTTATQDVACIAPPWAGGDAIDGPEGRDNGVGRLLQSQVEFIGFPVVTSAGIQENLTTGKALPIALLRVVGYSGKPDDDALALEWYDPARRTTPGNQPAWDGSDGWAVTPDSVAGPAEGSWPWTARNVANVSYVNDYTLVARFEGVVIVNFLEVSTPVHQAMLTAKLAQDPVSKAWRLDDAIISGRIETSVFLRFIPELVRAFIGLDNFCMDDGQYPDIKRLFCAYADLAGPDQQDPAEVCKFISFGARATALPIRFTGVEPRPSRPAACPPETDPINDSCSVP